VETQLFGTWLTETLDLQIDAYGVDPGELTGGAFAEFIRWNVLAADHELHEFMDHTQWKPWSNRRGEIRDRDGAVEELVDVLHFIANLSVAMGITTAELNRVYEHKMAVNKQRQLDNYDSFGKSENE
jgi:hypothetical protein